MSSYDPSTSGGVICTLEELAQSDETNPSIHCLTRGDSIGLTLAAEAAILSVLAVIFVYGLIIRNVFRHRRDFGEWRLIHEPLDLYILSLFTSDLIQAIATVLDIKWVKDGKLETGAICTMQGALEQLGDAGVAMATCAISIQTFVAVWWSKGLYSLTVAYTVVGCIWFFVILYVGIGVGIHVNYEIPTPYWCWIAPGFNGERITGEYMWFWITLFTSILVYIPLYFWSRGNITVDQERWFSFKIHWHRIIAMNKTDPDGRRRRSLIMLVYPIMYCIIILPLSVVRWINFSKDAHIHTASTATFAVNFIYELSGFLDVSLFLLTRPNILLFNTRTSTRRGRAPEYSPPRSPQHSRIDSVTPLQHLRSPEPVFGKLPAEEVPAWNFERSGRL